MVTDCLTKALIEEIVEWLSSNEWYIDMTCDESPTLIIRFDNISMIRLIVAGDKIKHESGCLMMVSLANPEYLRELNDKLRDCSVSNCESCQYYQYYQK